MSCGNPTCSAEGLLQCAACKSIKYCCLDCQRANWKHHKKICKSKKSPPPSITNETPDERTKNRELVFQYTYDNLVKTKPDLEENMRIVMACHATTTMSQEQFQQVLAKIKEEKSVRLAGIEEALMSALSTSSSRGGGLMGMALNGGGGITSNHAPSQSPPLMPSPSPSTSQQTAVAGIPISHSRRLKESDVTMDNLRLVLGPHANPDRMEEGIQVSSDKLNWAVNYNVRAAFRSTNGKITCNLFAGTAHVTGGEKSPPGQAAVTTGTSPRASQILHTQLLRSSMVLHMLTFLDCTAVVRWSVTCKSCRYIASPGAPPNTCPETSPTTSLKAFPKASFDETNDEQAVSDNSTCASSAGGQKHTKHTCTDRDVLWAALLQTHRYAIKQTDVDLSVDNFMLGGCWIEQPGEGSPAPLAPTVAQPAERAHTAEVWYCVDTAGLAAGNAAFDLFTSCHAARQARRCYKCSSVNSIVPCVYGFPSPIFLDAIKQKVLVMAGDYLLEGSASWTCVSCNYQFFSYPFWCGSITRVKR